MASNTVDRQAGSEPRTDLRGTNQSGMRAQNERLVLSLVRRHGALAKAELARMTGLSAQTVSVIMRALEDDGLLLRGDPVRGKVGQPSVPMRLAPQGALFFGLKVGRRSADLVLVDFLGRIVDRCHEVYRYPTPDGTLRFVEAALTRMTERMTDQQRAALAGLGIAIPGYLWEWAEIIGEPAKKMAAWREADIRADIAAKVGFPVYLQNDASCACGAELVFGAADHPKNFLHFYVGYFIGGGIVLGNTLFTGLTGNAGALGPLPVPLPGGAQGQLIDVASLSTLERAVAAAGGNGDTLWETPLGWQVDPAVLDPWIDGAASGLAHGIASCCSVIDFELVIIDGFLPGEVRRRIVARTAEKLHELDFAGLIRPDLREGTVGPDARALGAASLPLSARFLADAAA